MSNNFKEDNFICIDDYHKATLNILPTFALDYYESGADDELTKNENLQSFKKFLINPRFLVNVSSIDMSSSILGYKVSFPFGIAPTAMHRLSHDQGEIATAKAAFKAGIPMCLSSLSNTSLEEVASVCNSQGVQFFQLYYQKNRENTTRLLKGAKSNGYKAIVLTVDAPVSGMRRNDQRNKFSLPSHLCFPHFKEDKNATDNSTNSEIYNIISSFENSITWDDLSWIKKISELPLILKGILNPLDAELAKNYSVDAIWISNHGGRQIDGCPMAIDVLPEIVNRLKGTGIEIYIDGGIRKGSDIFKALALGANHVFIGRPILYGLAVDGEDGVTGVLNIFKKEFKRIMQLAGTANIKSITDASIIIK